MRANSSALTLRSVWQSSSELCHLAPNTPRGLRYRKASGAEHGTTWLLMTPVLTTHLRYGATARWACRHTGGTPTGSDAMTIRAAESLPTLDIRALGDAQLATAETVFNDFRNK